MRAVRRIQFCAGHRVYKHEARCCHLHGHNYVAYFHAEAVVSATSYVSKSVQSQLDDLGRVIDFAVLKEKLGGWIDEHWDHGFIVYEKDLEILGAFECVRESKLFVLSSNPTAENMAEYLLNVVAPSQLAGTGVRIVKVVLWETENCNAEVELDVREESNA